MLPVQWNAFGAFDLAVTVIACGAGWLVYRTRPSRRENRLLGSVLAVGGLSAGAYFGASLLAREPDGAAAAIGVGITLLLPLPALYLLFLGTLHVPLTRSLRTRAATGLLIAYVVSAELLWLTRPGWFLPEVVRYAGIGAWHLPEPGPALGLLGLGPLAVAQLFGLLVAVSAYRRAPTPGMRERAKAFAVAFGTRDLLGVGFITYFVALDGLRRPFGEALFAVTIPAVDLLFYLLLAYGILRTQLFDIDLRIKVTLERSAVAAPFAVVFFVTSEALEAAVPVDGFWLGLGAASLIVLALRPIQRSAAALTDRLMPGTTPTPDYLDARKRSVYRHAVEAVLEDRSVGAAERRVLDRLRHDLGIDPDLARGIEETAVRAFGLPPRAI